MEQKKTTPSCKIGVPQEQSGIVIGPIRLSFHHGGFTAEFVDHEHGVVCTGCGEVFNNRAQGNPVLCYHERKIFYAVAVRGHADGYLINDFERDELID